MGSLSSSLSSLQEDLVRYYLVEVMDHVGYVGTWCSLADTPDKALADCMDNCNYPVQLSDLHVKALKQHGWSTKVVAPTESTLDLLKEAQGFCYAEDGMPEHEDSVDLLDRIATHLAEIGE